MFFFRLPAILVPYTAGISEFCKQLMSIKRALNKETSYEISVKLDEKCSRGISYSSQTVFFQSVHYTCFSSAICPLQVPSTDLMCVACIGLLSAEVLTVNTGLGRPISGNLCQLSTPQVLATTYYQLT